MAVYVSHLAEPGTKAWPVFVPVWCELLLRMAKRHRKTSRTRYSGKSHEKQGNNRRAKRKGNMAKARSTTTGASVRARATSKPRSAKAPARPVSKSAVKPRKRHHLLGFLAAIFALLALAGTAARALPADLQELPFVPIVVSATPWFMLLGLVALLLAIVSRRILAALIAAAAIACNGY